MFSRLKKLNKHQKLVFGCMAGVILFMICITIVARCYVVQQNKKIEKQELKKKAAVDAWCQRSANFANYYILDDLRKSVAKESEELAQLLDRKFPVGFVPTLYSDKKKLDELIAGKEQDSVMYANEIVRVAGRYIHYLDMESGRTVFFTEAARYLDEAIKNRNPDALTLAQNEEDLKKVSLILFQHRFWKRRILDH